jgi:hypothetical protein
VIFGFGGAQDDRVQIDVLGYEQPASSKDKWDLNWLRVEVRVQVVGFCAHKPITVQTGEVADFLADLEKLHAALSGDAVFETMEDELEMKLSGDARGHIHLRGRVGRAGSPGVLSFNLQFDQSQLQESIREIRKVMKLFPQR